MPFANLPGDLQMHYEDDDFTDPWAEAETVIFHHGQGKNGKLLYGWVQPLAGEFRVIRVDARGFGKSSVPAPGYNWSLDGFATDLLNLMDCLGIDKAHIVGETIGGTIALQFAHRFPDRLHTVTACTSPFNFRGVQTYVDYYNLVKDKGVEAWVRETSQLRLVPGKSDPRHREWYMQQMSQTSQHVVLETLAYLATVDLTPILPEIKTPALVLAGALSGVYVERARKLSQLLPNCRLAEVPGVGGFAQHEAPGECAAIWMDFVSQLALAAKS
jgi:pimeloyl-ACP methyl ester carboxylesterase